MNRGIYYGAGHKFFSCANHKSTVHLRIALWELKKLNRGAHHFICTPRAKLRHRFLDLANLESLRCSLLFKLLLRPRAHVDRCQQMSRQGFLVPHHQIRKVGKMHEGTAK